MAVHPLRPAMDRRLGGPLPHQLANPTRVHLIPPEFFTPDHAVLCAYAVLAVISDCYPPCTRQVTHALLTRPPLELNHIDRSFNKVIPVRLACVKHAASVHPEPGSNSLIKCLIHLLKTTVWLSLVFTAFGLFKPFFKCKEIFENRMCFTV